MVHPPEIDIQQKLLEECDEKFLYFIFKEGIELTNSSKKGFTWKSLLPNIFAEIDTGG